MQVLTLLPRRSSNMSHPLLPRLAAVVLVEALGSKQVAVAPIFSMETSVNNRVKVFAPKVLLVLA